ncbi:MAG: hypothetical protein IT370_21025, partial [Deltaproteobacteria bacterium]|nr:hypothetical protein [Deltaproteobacteria bacterium]
ATIATSRGRHTFPVENGEPVVLDPIMTRNALSAGLYLIRQGEADAQPQLAEADPSDLLPWIAEVAEEPAEARDGRAGVERVRRARKAFRAVLAGRPAKAEGMRDVLYTLDRAEEAAPLFGQIARSAIRVARAALKSLAARPAGRRNGCCGPSREAVLQSAGTTGALVLGQKTPEVEPRNLSLSWKKLGYWGGKGLSRVLGVGDLYDPALNAAKKQLARLKAAPAAQRRQGMPPLAGLWGLPVSPISLTRPATVPSLLDLLSGKGR